MMDDTTYGAWRDAQEASVDLDWLASQDPHPGLIGPLPHDIVLRPWAVADDEPSDSL